MKIINITEEQRNKLCNELAKILLDFKKDENVECIYFAPYKGLGKIRGYVLELTLIEKDANKDEKIKEYNTSHQNEETLSELGVKIEIDIEDESKYPTIELDPTQLKKYNNLFNSVILFDRTGKYTRIKKQLEKFEINKGTGIYYYENLAEIEPPIMDKINDSIEAIEKGIDTQPVKKITKKKIFKFKDKNLYN